MPMKAKRPCRHPNCPNLTNERYCETHKALHPDRPSAARRGYGSRWQRISRTYLKKHPLCVKCLSNGKFVEATVVDHIIPHRGDKLLFWNESNWQALCKPCHDRKTWTEDNHPEYRY